MYSIRATIFNNDNIFLFFTAAIPITKSKTKT